MHQYRGRLIVHTGSMFSGKTSSLENDLKRFEIANYRVLCFKPSVDTRHDKEEICTHEGRTYTACSISHVSELKKVPADVDVVGIDEVQFLGGTIEEIRQAIEELLDRGVTVVVAGLDMDFSAKPFEITKELMPMADYLTKHHAVCTRCGADAWVSHRKSDSTDRVVIGASEEYEPVCRTCYHKILEEEKKS